jgi:hypothetical protein
MNLWKVIEQKLWTGQIIKEYGALADDRLGTGKRTISALLARKGDRDRFVIKASYRAFLAASVQYIELDRDAAAKLKAASR